MKSFLYKDSFFFFVLGLFCLFLFWKPIHIAPMLNFDDPYIIKPLENVRSINDYQILWRDNVILDIQPVRDISYILEFRFAELTNLKMRSVLVNLIFWLCSLIFVFKIFQHQLFTNLESKIMITYLALHPAVVNSIAWGSSRKHVLSMFFISGATFFWLKWIDRSHFKNAVFVVVLYFLSCFSQPINAAWFIWAGLSL